MGYWWIPAVISAVSSLYSTYKQGKAAKNALNAAGNAPLPPDYAWLTENGPAMWDYLSRQGRGLIDNPQGIPGWEGITSGLRSQARTISATGLSEAERTNATRTAAAGLSPGGGTSSRQSYLAGRGFASDLTSRLTDIDINSALTDYQAREEQRNRGYNLLLSLSNRSPVYSQIVSQNYWNAVNAAQGQLNASNAQFGATSNALMEYFLNQQLRSDNNYNGPYYNSPYAGTYYPPGDAYLPGASYGNR